MLRTLFDYGQKAALTLGLPLLLFLGLRIEKGEEQNLASDAKLAFALLAAILLLLTGGMWAELGLLWPLLVAVPFLVLLASALFTRISPEHLDKQ